MKKRILIDMDGVVADFIGSACETHGIPNPYLSPPYPRGNNAWDVLQYVNIEPGEFWGKLDYDFWASLSLTKEAPAIIDICTNAVGKKNVCFLSSPCMTRGCCEGKRDWAKCHFGNVPLFLNAGTLSKEFFADRHTLLVDDNSMNIRKFILAGGWACLVPRPWNTAYEVESFLLTKLDNMLKAFVGLSQEWEWKQ